MELLLDPTANCTSPHWMLLFESCLSIVQHHQPTRPTKRSMPSVQCQVFNAMHSMPSIQCQAFNAKQPFPLSEDILCYFVAMLAHQGLVIQSIKTYMDCSSVSRGETSPTHPVFAKCCRGCIGYSVPSVVPTTDKVANLSALTVSA